LQTAPKTNLKKKGKKKRAKFLGGANLRSVCSVENNRQSTHPFTEGVQKRGGVRKAEGPNSKKSRTPWKNQRKKRGKEKQGPRSRWPRIGGFASKWVGGPRFRGSHLVGGTFGGCAKNVVLREGSAIIKQLPGHNREGEVKKKKRDGGAALRT